MPNKLLSSLFLICFTISLVAISPAQALTKLKDMDCDGLIAKSKEETYVLNHLAALYANRTCKDFSFDFKNLTETERKIFKMKFDELDESKKVDLKDTDTIDSLRLAYKNEKSSEEKFNLFKKLRQKYRAANRRDESFKLIKSNHAELVKLINKQTKSKKPQTVSYDIYIESTQIYAKALWNDNQVDEAIKLIQTSMKTIGDKKPTYALSFLIGKIQEDRMLFESAIENYDRALASYKSAKEKKLSVDKSFDLTKVEWSKAWIQYKNDDPSRAAAALKGISDNSTDPAEKSRANFFLAKIYKKLKKSDEAKKALEHNINNDFFSFYSLASYYELDRPLPTIESISNSASTTNTFNIDTKLSFLGKNEKELFSALAENDEFEMLDRAAILFAKNNTEYVNLGLNLAENSKFFMPLFTGFARLNISEKKEIFAKYSRLLFPEIHTEKVNEMSKKTNIPSSLIYSIMKQESGFNPESRSHADALGLMQVIPRLAKSLAKKYKIETYKKMEDLYNPLVNIELGTYELKDQVEKQNGQLSFVASAYNAGPNALKEWRKKEPIQDMFEFIENIPYDETRSYVKIIARNMLFYQRLASPDKELTFPTDFIKITKE